MILQKKKVLEYKENGIIKIKLSKNILKLKDLFLKDTIEFFRYFDERKFTKKINKKNFQEYLLNLRKRNRTLISKYYKVSRRFASLKCITTSEEFIKISKQLMNTKLVSICHFIALRIDFNEERNKGYITDTHQDFPYIQGSLNGVTFWMPIYSTDTPPEYLPGSHKFGLQKYKEFSRDKNSGTRTLEIVKNFNKTIKYKSTSCKSNEILIFDTLLIHKSSKKQEIRPRLSLQLRYDDICKKDMFDKNYPEGLYLGDSFKKNFREYVI